MSKEYHKKIYILGEDHRSLTFFLDAHLLSLNDDTVMIEAGKSFKLPKDYIHIEYIFDSDTRNYIEWSSFIDGGYQVTDPNHSDYDLQFQKTPPPYLLLKKGRYFPVCDEKELDELSGDDLLTSYFYDTKNRLRKLGTNRHYQKTKLGKKWQKFFKDLPPPISYNN